MKYVYEIAGEAGSTYVVARNMLEAVENWKRYLKRLGYKNIHDPLSVILKGEAVGG